jgi:tRNA dimethylallyltransferase
MLQKLDPRRARKIDRHNPVRLIRAIEIAKALGRVPPLSDSSPKHTYTITPTDRRVLSYEKKKEKTEVEIKWVGMKTAEIPLRTKIHTRLLSRMKAGMVAEAKKLHRGGLSYKRMEQLGLEYRYLALLLQKKITKKEMLEQLENRIWDYARRQKMYWKRNADIVWK